MKTTFYLYLFHLDTNEWYNLVNTLFLNYEMAYEPVVLQQKRDERIERRRRTQDTDRRPSHTSVSSSTPSSERTIQQLRAERLRREQDERAKAQRVLAKLRGEKTGDSLEARVEVDDRERGYNSQFNPELARKRKPQRDGY